MFPLTFLADQIGETDCETIGDGLLAQPANAISSGSYVLIGLWLAVRAIRSAGPERPTAIAYSVALASVGIGSILFHGPMPAGARLVHDLTIAAVFAVIAARAVGQLRRWPQVGVVGAAALITSLVGGVMAISPEVGIGLSGVVGVAALGLEVYLYRTGRRRPLSKRDRGWLIAVFAFLALAGIANVLGRTDAPLCDPDSVLQGHALWHVMTALAFGVYGAVTFSAANEPAG
jgi:hypothetical protein